MPRAIVLVLVSVGIGAAPDAGSYGDCGADTVGHIAEAWWHGRARWATAAWSVRGNRPHSNGSGTPASSQSAHLQLPSILSGRPF
jgi:phosphopentomutase